MKNKFSKKWISSRQPRKQRKYIANAHFKIKHKLLSSHLSKDLKKKYSRRSFPVRKGDTVKVMRGEFQGKSGKISIVDLQKMKVIIEGMQIQKKDGTKINAVFEPSNLLITELNLEDKKREQSIKKQKEAPSK